MADDVLAKLTPAQVAAFYARLADGVDARKGKLDVSLAALLMRLWLTNRKAGDTLTIDAPTHLRTHPLTRDSLLYHRQVFLTEKKARLGKSQVWAGVVPRLQGKPPHQKRDIQRPISMEYESLTEFPLRYQVTGSDADRDLLYSLHGFQLHSKVTVAGTLLPRPPKGSQKVRINFQSFVTEAKDVYDWDYSEHLTVPNPDFGSKMPGAVTPESNTVLAYHRNAKRIEDAGLAAPYSFVTKSWIDTDTAITAPGDVDPSRSL